jgi:hypothetical protein
VKRPSEEIGVRKPALLPAAALRCSSGANCLSYPSLGEPSKLSRGNLGPTCFACEKQRVDFEFEAVAAKPKSARPRQEKRPSRSDGCEPGVRHQHAEVNRASAILERRSASVLTCKRGLQSAIASDDAGHARTWSKALRDAEARLLWAEADLEASEIRAESKVKR